MLYVYSTKTSGIKFQIEEGTKVTSYEPYIPSVKMIADEVSAQNESLEDYGLDNKFANGLAYGYCSYSGGNFSFEDLTENDNYIGSKTEYSCIGGEPLKILFSQTMEQITIQFNNNSFFTVNNVDKIETVIPSGVTKLSFYVKKNGIKISNIGYIGIYINNSIDELKNDLSNFTSGQYIDGSTDWNTIKISGMYYYNGWSGSGGSNKPTETKTIGMAFILNTGNTLLQFAVLSSGNSYFRNGTIDEPGSWVAIS